MGVSRSGSATSKGVEFAPPILELHLDVLFRLAEGDVDGMDALLVEAIFDDVGEDLLNGDKEVIAEPPADLVLGGKAFKDRIHPEQVLNPVFDGDANFLGFHWAESSRDCKPARRKT